MATVVASPVRRWTAAEVQDLMIELLGDLLNEEPEDLRERLLSAGPMMPVDSLDLFDVLQSFRDKTGLTLPVRKLRRDTLRSVRSFAAFVEEETAQ